MALMGILALLLALSTSCTTVPWSYFELQGNRVEANSICPLGKKYVIVNRKAGNSPLVLQTEPEVRAVWEGPLETDAIPIDSTHVLCMGASGLMAFDIIDDEQIEFPSPSGKLSPALPAFYRKLACTNDAGAVLLIDPGTWSLYFLELNKSSSAQLDLVDIVESDKLHINSMALSADLHWGVFTFNGGVRNSARGLAG
jgi:hypothetical protein